MNCLGALKGLKFWTLKKQFLPIDSIDPWNLMDIRDDQQKCYDQEKYEQIEEGQLIQVLNT